MTAPYTAANLKRFAKAELSPRLASDFVAYAGRDVVRNCGCFVQLLALSGGRYGETLKVIPTFYVVGCFPFDSNIPQSVALGNSPRSRWDFVNASLDASLADFLIRRLKEESPISFLDPLHPPAIVEGLRKIARSETSFHSSAYLGAFLISIGDDRAAEWIEKAKSMFIRACGRLQHDWQIATVDRLKQLHVYATRRSAEVFKEEATVHAARLKLPHKSAW